MRDELKDHTDVEIDFFRVPTKTDRYLFINIAQITRVALNGDSARIYMADGCDPIEVTGDILDKLVPWIEARSVLSLVSEEGPAAE